MSGAADKRIAGKREALFVAELRLALFDKRGHALGLILGREERVEKAAFEEQALAERRLVGAVDSFLDRHRRDM